MAAVFHFRYNSVVIVIYSIRNSPLYTNLGFRVQSLLGNPEWVVGGLLLCLLLGWIVLRGPRVFAGLKQVRSHRQEIELRREMYANQVASFLKDRASKSTAHSDDVDSEKSLIGPRNLTKNWRWLLAGFGLVAIGVFSYVNPQALNSFEFVGRRRGIGIILQLLWGWPIATIGLAFGLLCVFISFMPMED